MHSLEKKTKLNFFSASYELKHDRLLNLFLSERMSMTIDRTDHFDFLYSIYVQFHSCNYYMYNERI